MKTIENQGFLTTSGAMGRSGPVKKPSSFRISNKINGFEHISYGTALILLTSCSVSIMQDNLFDTGRAAA
jgi:hypothetical protein